ncbi:MAG: hypothetical protein HY908_15165 [Myxococcales bacterium]|nr:hypothetical protein [Myxococcales bacterium]
MTTRPDRRSARARATPPAASRDELRAAAVQALGALGRAVSCEVLATEAVGGRAEVVAHALVAGLVRELVEAHARGHARRGDASRLGLASLTEVPWLVPWLDQGLARTALAALSSARDLGALELEDLGAVYEELRGHALVAGPGGRFALVPGDARRRSGTHFTPRALTAPVVERALRPLFARLGPSPAPEAIVALAVCDPAMGSGAFLLEAGRQLAAALAVAWQRAGTGPAVAGAALAEAARREVVARCLYGVDCDATVAALARACLWLFAGAPAALVPRLAHALRHGDALVGLPYGAGAGPSLARARRAVVGSRTLPVTPLDWAQAFPEVLTRAAPGFDCVVGNPPFLGGKRISTSLGRSYRDWLAALHPDASRNTDLAAHFLRRTFTLLCPGGTLGLVTTNSIAQGDTRVGGLLRVREAGGVVYAAERRVRWPGAAAVVVSLLHVAKDFDPGWAELDGRPVARITAFLASHGEDAAPARLADNRARAFIGCFVRGMGFTFDDANPEATPLAELERLAAAEPATREAVLEYLGGEEVSTSPTQSARRFVIFFGDASEEEVRRRWPGLYALVRQKVLPARTRLGDSPIDRKHKRLWWRFANDRPELRAALAGRTRALVVPRLARHLVAAWLPLPRIFSDQLVVFPDADDALFAVLSSRLHLVWARSFASTLGDGLRYNPTDCFETFPLPPGSADGAALAAVARAFEARRAALCRARGEGLTRCYNRLHDPTERSRDVAGLRDLAAELDRAVLDAYGFGDLVPVLDFRPRPEGVVRLDWDAASRDEALGRLLRLNTERARSRLQR